MYVIRCSPPGMPGCCARWTNSKTYSGAGKPAPRQGDGRLDQLRPRQPSAAVQAGQSGDDAWRADGGMPEIGAVVVEQRVVAELGATAKIGGPHVGRGARAGAGVKGDMLLAARPGVGGAAEAAEATHLRVGDHLREGGADGGVEGVSSARQELGADLGRQAVAARRRPLSSS